MSVQPQLLKGFRDFLPEEKRARDFVQGKIIETFQRFGFEAVETPTLEYKSLLTGKYGEEADKLVYAFTDNGDREVAMRYDQTVPTARFIANNLNDLPMPFRRYQIQNVFRAEKPQKGRYREFTQCDIDIFGSTDVPCDAELLACVDAVYKNIGFPSIQIVVNDRQTLMSVLLPYETTNVSVFSIIQSIDKLDKLSKEDVVAELVRKGLSDIQSTQALSDLLSVQPSAELEQTMSLAIDLGVSQSTVRFEPSLARGLDYYTGIIFEVRIPEFTAGSVCGGGRYDELIGKLCGIDMPANGCAFGFDRTVEAAVQLGLIPSREDEKKILVTIFDESLVGESARVAKELRNRGLSTELYPKYAKLDKQFKYADKKGIRYCVVIGSNEVASKTIVVKDMKTGEQNVMTVQEFLK